MKEDYQKAIKKLALFFFFRTQSLLMGKIIKTKGGLELVTSRSSGYEASSKNIFISYVLFDQLWWCNIKRFFELFQKITSTNLCKPIHDIINYSTSTCPFESGKCGKEGKKFWKIVYLENEKSFFNVIKNIFYSFWGAIIWWKIKIW